MDGFERWEVGWEISMSELVDEFWLGQVAQPELAQPLQPEPAAQTAQHQVACGLRDQHLPAVPGRLHPGTPVDRRMVNAVAAGRPGLPGVQSHPHPQSRPLGPRLPPQGQLALPGRLDCGHRAGKHGEETVALPPGRSPPPRHAPRLRR
jgi:hypothetical protein